MEKKLNLKTIDTPLKAFLIGHSNCCCWNQWQHGQELLNKNILLLEFTLSQYNEDERFFIRNWFIKNFSEYGQTYMQYVPHKLCPTLYLELRITPESKDNIGEKYIPVKKELYDYYIRGMFWNNYVFRSKNTYLNYTFCFTGENYNYGICIKNVVNPEKICIIHINGNKHIIPTVAKKLQDYYNLTNYYIRKNNIGNTLIYLPDNKNTEYFNSVFEKTQDLFDFEF